MTAVVIICIVPPEAAVHSFKTVGEAGGISEQIVPFEALPLYFRYKTLFVDEMVTILGWPAGVTSFGKEVAGISSNNNSSLLILNKTSLSLHFCIATELKLNDCKTIAPSSQDDRSNAQTNNPNNFFISRIVWDKNSIFRLQMPIKEMLKIQQYSYI